MATGRRAAGEELSAWVREGILGLEDGWGSVRGILLGGGGEGVWAAGPAAGRGFVVWHGQDD